MIKCRKFGTDINSMRKIGPKKNFNYCRQYSRMGTARMELDKETKEERNA